MADIFISYKRRIRPQVEALAAILRQAGYSVWFDASLNAGERFGAEIAREVRRAKCVLVCWTNDAFPHGGDTNGWVISEATMGRNRSVYVPLALEPVDLDPPFNGDHVIDMAPWLTTADEAPLRAMLAAVMRHAGPPTPGEHRAETLAASAVAPEAATAPAHTGYGSKAYRAYVLAVLVIIYTFNFIDRLLISIVQEPIKAEFGISNLMLGLLGGPAFAILYTVLGIPIARYAERANRINVVAMGAAVWSVMTAACGMAGNFVQLAAARIGVGIGEAACVPPSHSAISDYFPPERRATALAIFSLGIPFGSALAAVGGGWLVQNFDWRTAFLMLGLPGVAAALLLRLTVKEPPRTGAKQAKATTLGETVRTLSSKASFWHVAFGGALISFVGYGSSQFLVSHIIRNYNLGATLSEEVANASYAFGLIAGVSTALGTFLGGFLADRLAHRHKHVLSWLPALGMAFAVPLYALSFIQTEFIWAFACLLLAPIAHYLYLGPMYAVTQGVATPRTRATATAVLLLIVNLIGYGLGPPFVGAANDWFAANILADGGLALAQCADIANAAACASADAQGLRYALIALLAVLVWASVHFLLAGRTLLKDRTE